MTTILDCRLQPKVDIYVGFFDFARRLNIDGTDIMAQHGRYQDLRASDFAVIMCSFFFIAFVFLSDCDTLVQYYAAKKRAPGRFFNTQGVSGTESCDFSYILF
jgi:hypothetical protein